MSIFDVQEIARETSGAEEVPHHIAAAQQRLRLEFMISFVSDEIFFNFFAVIRKQMTMRYRLEDVKLVGMVRLDIYLPKQSWQSMSVDFCFLECPLIHFNIRSKHRFGVDVSNVPGLSEWIHKFVRDYIKQWYTWPAYFTYPLGEGEPIKRDGENAGLYVYDIIIAFDKEKDVPEGFHPLLTTWYHRTPASLNFDEKFTGASGGSGAGSGSSTSSMREGMKENVYIFVKRGSDRARAVTELSCLTMQADEAARVRLKGDCTILITSPTGIDVNLAPRGYSSSSGGSSGAAGGGDPCVYLCYRKGGVSPPVKRILLGFKTSQSSSSELAPSGFKTIPIPLGRIPNERELYLFYEREVVGSSGASRTALSSTPDPVVDLCVLVYGMTIIPDGFTLVDLAHDNRTSGDLMAGCGSRAVYIGYKRDRFLAPLVDIMIVRNLRSLPEGYTVIRRTVSGLDASLSRDIEDPLYLAYKRQTSSREAVIVDVIVVVAGGFIENMKVRNYYNLNIFL